MATNETAVERVETWVRDRLAAEDCRAHGWMHTDRVRRHIRVLANAEGVDPVLAEIAALIHDVGRTQLGPESEHGQRSATLAEPMLAQLAIGQEGLQAILHAVRWHNSRRTDTPLLCVLRDADMLDAMGAVGIMRALMSKSDLPAYDPAGPIDLTRSSQPPLTAFDHVLRQGAFYDMLNTDTARLMASERVAFMRAFVTQAQREIRQES